MSSPKTQPRLFSNQRNFKFISNLELQFFKKLISSRGQFSGRNMSVDKALTNVSGFVSSNGDNPLNIIVSFDISTGKKKFGVDQMHLGTQLKPHKSLKECQATHFMALTLGNVCKLKFHVDLDFDSTATEFKPSPHIQIGGRALTGLSNTFESPWDTKLDKPRWPSLPCCTPLLWHAAFQEFYDCESVNFFVTSNWWRKLVSETEKDLWDPFISDMASAISKKIGVIESLYPHRG